MSSNNNNVDIQLNEHLIRLATEYLIDKQQLDDFIKFLKGIYTKDFRHNYSNLFSVIMKIVSDENNLDIDIFADNLENVKQRIMSNESEEYTIVFNKSFNKLYDHLNLEIGRYNSYYLKYLKSMEAEKQLNNANALLSEAQEKVSSMSKETMDALKSSQKDYISILSVFAAIVLAFTGGITFSTSVLQNIDSVSIYRICFVMLILGFILLNTIYVLVYYLNKIVYKREKNDKNYQKPIIIINVVLIVAMFILSAFWYCGTVEKRNYNIENELNNMSISTFYCIDDYYLNQ